MLVFSFRSHCDRRAASAADSGPEQVAARGPQGGRAEPLVGSKTHTESKSHRIGI